MGVLHALLCSFGQRSQPPVVVVKADDLRVSQKLEPWLELWDWAQARNIPVSCGVIGESLAEATLAHVQRVRECAEEGFHEFWNHGYTHSLWDSGATEFCGPSAENQARSLVQTQQLLWDVLGVRATVFGAPFNRTDSHTPLALGSVPEISTVYFAEVVDRSVIPSYFFVALDYQKKTLAKMIRDRARLRSSPVVVVQCHPDHLWETESAMRLYRCLEMLRAEGARFVSAARVSRDGLFQRIPGGG